MDRILVATDLSEWSSRAESRAAMLCRHLNCASVELCVVNETGPLASLAGVIGVTTAAAQDTVARQAMQELESRCTRLRTSHGTLCSAAVRFGSPAQEILSAAHEIDATLIVAGAHGSGSMTDLFLGNTVDKLIHLANRPLLVVKNPAAAPYRRVLVPVDFSTDSTSAAKLAMRMAPAGAITFLHVFEVEFEGLMHYASVAGDVIASYRTQARNEARDLLNQFISNLTPEDEGQLLTRAIVLGSPAAAIARYAQDMQPDLIVMGKHGRSWMEELLIGSVTRDTLDRTGSDLLIASSGHGLVPSTGKS